MLVGMLNRHPQIKCLGELMRPTPEWMLRTGYKAVLTVLENVDPKFKDDIYRLSNAESFVREVFSLFPGNSNYGFKLHLDQNRRYLDRLIANPEWRIVLLRRENILAQYSSQKIAMVTGQGAAKKGSKIKKATVLFDASEFKSFLAERQKRWDEVRRRLDESGKTFFTIYYTQLLSKKFKAGLLQYLTADPQVDLEPGSEKRNPSNILTRFSNRREAERELDAMSLMQWSEESFEH